MLKGKWRSMSGRTYERALALERIHPASRVSCDNRPEWQCNSNLMHRMARLHQMDRRNKISVTTMPPSKRSSTSTPKERGGDFTANPRDLVGFEGLEMLAHVSLAWMTPEEAARVQAAEVAEAAANGAVNTLRSMSIYDDQMSRVSDAMVSQPDPKSD